MTEEIELEQETKRRIRANVKQIFLTREISIALNKMLGEKEIDEKNGILLTLAYGLYKMGFMNDVRFERMNQKYSFSIVKSEDDAFLNARKKQAEELEQKIIVETDRRTINYFNKPEHKAEMENLGVEERKKLLMEKNHQMESEVRKEFAEGENKQ